MTAEADFKRDIRCVGAETGAGSADVVPKDQQNDICECPKCGRQHRYLGNPPWATRENAKREEEREDKATRMIMGWE